MAKGGCLLSAFVTFSKDANHYRKIKNSREASVSTACAGRAIKHVIFGTGICIGLIVLSMFLMQNENPFLQVFSLVILVASGIGALVSTLHGIVNSFYQIALPKKSAGLISLIITILGLAGAIAAVVITLGAIS